MFRMPGIGECKPSMFGMPVICECEQTTPENSWNLRNCKCKQAMFCITSICGDGGKPRRSPLKKYRILLCSNKQQKQKKTQEEESRKREQVVGKEDKGWV
jgi:hypothetical protein